MAEMAENATAVEETEVKDKGGELLPILPNKIIYIMTLGFLGVNMAFSLQGANMSRIAQTIGADPNQLGWFFIVPPLLGMIVQPLIGKWSDATWNRWGRRMPYLVIGGPVAALVLVLLPFSGSFGFGYGSLFALVYMIIAIALMDCFSNISMAPFRMIIGDMVNDKQRNFAFAWSEIFAYIGGILASLLPYILTWLGVPNTADKGVVPPSVVWSFIIAAVVLLVSSLFSGLKTKEYDPETYAKYHGIDIRKNAQKKTNWIELFKNAPRSFWELSVVQFFSWIGIMYTWTYATNTMAVNIWGTNDTASSGFQAAGNWYGVMTAVYSVAALVFGWFYSRSAAKNRRHWYAFGLAADVIAIVVVATTHNQWVALAAFILYGFGNFCINTLPFNMLTTALKKDVGAYLGAFNIFVCLPQIVGSVAGLFLVPAFGGNTMYMMLLGAVFMAISVVSVYFVHEGK